VSLQAVAVSTECLQVRRVVVPFIPVNVVHVQLTDMYWVEAALLAFIFLMDCVWVDEFVVGFLIDSLALVFSTEVNLFRVPHLDFSRATD